MTTPLGALRCGHSGVIVHVTSNVHNAHRLRELGLGEGRTIRVLQQSDPLLCQVDETRVGLARNLADAIHVTPLV